MISKLGGGRHFSGRAPVSARGMDSCRPADSFIAAVYAIIRGTKKRVSLGVGEELVAIQNGGPRDGEHQNCWKNF